MPRKHRAKTSPSFGDNSSGNNRHRRSFSLTDEGFISFCFEDNETFYIVKDQKTEFPNILECPSMRAKRKLNYEDGVVSDIAEYEGEEPSERGSYDEQGEDEDEDEETIYFDPESPAPGFVHQEHYIGTKIHPDISNESSASNDTRSSFAFPVLNRVWSGSPIKMPRTAGMHLRKHKDWRLVFLCCRRF